MPIMALKSRGTHLYQCSHGSVSFFLDGSKILLTKTILKLLEDATCVVIVVNNATPKKRKRWKIDHPSNWQLQA
jgi:hypothetical protein